MAPNINFEVVKMDNLGPHYGPLKFTKQALLQNLHAYAPSYTSPEVLPHTVTLCLCGYQPNSINMRFTCS